MLGTAKRAAEAAVNVSLPSPCGVLVWSLVWPSRCSLVCSTQSLAESPEASRSQGKWSRNVMTAFSKLLTLTYIPFLQIILDAVDKPRVISFKGAADLVTETDKRSEEAIIKVHSLSAA